ncbi:MAG: universal stress protein [Hyphomicrobiaceae bacterium]
MVKKRRVFEQGHRRKYLVILDETPEVESALFFAASRIGHSGGQIVMLYVIEPTDFTQWAGVKDVQLEEETAKAKALFRLNRRKLDKTEGFEQISTEEVIRSGKRADEILKLIDEDEDIAIMILGASIDTRGPGPLVTSLATGKLAGSFPIPIVVVPGNLSVDDLKAMA